MSMMHVKWLMVSFHTCFTGTSRQHVDIEHMVLLDLAALKSVLYE